MKIKTHNQFNPSQTTKPRIFLYCNELGSKKFTHQTGLIINERSK